MSASLVGSEMCIRDSTLFHGTRTLTLRTLFEEPRKPKRSETETASGPVSYTHLTLPTICSV
eukprot:1714699-Alexandrium_andersonii.AAC.1